MSHHPTQRSSKLLITNAIVLTMDESAGNFDRADVLVENGAIAAIGPDLERAGAQIVDGSDSIVMPGLVDSHRHLWHTALRNVLADATSSQFMAIAGKAGGRFTPGDVYLSSRLGAAEALNAGITTLLDWCHVTNSPAHADAAVQAALDSGVRIVFAHGTPLTFPDDQIHADIRRVRDTWFPGGESLVTLAMAARGPERTSPEISDTDFALARELGLGISFHTGAWSGSDGSALRALYERKQLGPDINYVHLNYTRPDVLDLIAETGGTASITPFAEMMMGAGHPPTDRLLARGIPTGLGTDTALWGASSLFTETKLALGSVRALEAARAAADKQHYTQVGLRAAQALDLVTRQSAKAIWLEDKVGSLTPGKRADLLLIKRTSANLAPVSNAGQALAAVATSAESSNVEAVMVDGRWVKWHGQLVGIDLVSLRHDAEAIRQRIAG
jgi:5-methylthioadenosine/S-adenosylhomocysteine deaminase